MIKRLLSFSIIFLSFSGAVYSGGNPYILGIDSILCVSDEIVLGHSTTSMAFTPFNEFVYFAKYTALKSCSIDSVNLSLSDNGESTAKVRVGVYADSSGPTGAPLISSGETTTGNANAAQELVVNLGGTVSMTGGTSYWISFWFSNNTMLINRKNVSDNSSAYVSGNYHSTNAFPTSPSVTLWNNSNFRAQGLAP